MNRILALFALTVAGVGAEDGVLVGVCENVGCGSSGCAADYVVGLAIECEDLRLGDLPESALTNTPWGCLCVGEKNCQSCPNGTSFRALNETEDARFVRNGTAAAFEDAAKRDITVGEVLVSTPTIVAQHLSLRVDGDGPELSRIIGDGATRLFVVEATGTLDVRHVALRNGSALDAVGGGCVLVGRYAALRLTGVALQNCVSWTHGGGAAIFPGSTVTAIGTAIFDVSASFGHGGAIFGASSTSLRFSHSNFTSCFAAIDGGCVWSHWSAEFDNVAITKSVADDDGGGVYAFVDGSLRFTNTIISDCVAGAYGGGVGSDGIVVELVRSRI